MTRPIRVEIDLAAIRHNYLKAKQKAPGSLAFAALKANAYGHGVLEAAQALADCADGLALLNIEDAVLLRQAGINLPIMMLEGPFDGEEVRQMAVHRLAAVLHNERQLDWLDGCGALTVWVKLNSGMNRLGFVPERLPAVLERLAGLPNVQVAGVMTHFATADDERGIAEQWAEFLRWAGPAGLAISAANSAAIWSYPDTHRQLVRPGICLYGCSPFADRLGRELELQPAMRLSADIIAIQQLKAGDAVGYGRRFVTERAMRIGIVACGYGDGYPRVAPNGTPVAVDSAPSGIVGRVSMDMLAVDLTALPAAGLGSTVELWGPQVPIETVAQAAGTIGYELMCAVTQRVPRIYRPV
jgi:alanine racemase